MTTRGIANIGNTCSVNALLQCFAHCKAIRSFFTETSIAISYKGNHSLTRELVQTLRELWTQGDDAVVVPKGVLLALYEKYGDVLHHGEQHDICEVCTLLCDKVAEECFTRTMLSSYEQDDVPKIVAAANAAMKRHNAKNVSVWLDMVQGVILAMVQCSNPACREAYFNFEPFIVLPLNIPERASTLRECLDATFKNEDVSDWTCDKCKCRGGTKVTRLWKMPRVFCISLNRFAHDLRKNNDHIDVPMSMTLTPDSILGPDAGAMEYRLCSVALHHGGSIWGGHYTAVVSRSDGTWVHCDDTCTQTVPHPNVAQVYLMMYERA